MPDPYEADASQGKWLSVKPGRGRGFLSLSRPYRLTWFLINWCGSKMFHTNIYRGWGLLIMSVVAVAAFVLLGQAVGWRVLGVAQLMFSIRVIRSEQVGMGWEGFGPSFHLRGRPAIALGTTSVCIAIVLLFFPEKTIMRWSWW